MSVQLYAVLGLLVLMFQSLGYSQSIDEVLKQVEQNNKELSAMRMHINSQNHFSRSEFSLDAPEISGYLLQPNASNLSNYTEFQISQSFDFPSVYIHQKNWLKKKKEEREADYNRQRIRILLQAKSACIELVYLNRLQIAEEERLKQANRIVRYSKLLVEKGEQGILALNKAKVVKLQKELELAQIKTQIEQIRFDLEAYNGGEKVFFSAIEYPHYVELLSLDSLWGEKLRVDPELVALQKQLEAQEQALAVEKAKRMPNFSLGVNVQGTEEGRYAGVYGGLSIPLWKQQYAIKSVENKVAYQTVLKDLSTDLLFSQFQKEFESFLLHQNGYLTYKKTLDSLSDEGALFKAYEAGMFSYLEYYMEVQFYQDAWNKMLLFEKELHHNYSQLLKYRL